MMSTIHRLFRPLFVAHPSHCSRSTSCLLIFDIKFEYIDIYICHSKETSQNSSWFVVLNKVAKCQRSLKTKLNHMDV